MATPHDTLFCQVFGRPEHAADLLRGALPAPLAAAIDWPSLTLCEGTFVDAELREQQADLLFEATLHGEPLLVYVLLEHKSTSDRFTAMQVHGYVAEIWRRWRREHPSADLVPNVIPVVVHHGERPWRAPRILGELLERGGPDPEVAAILRSMQPTFRLRVDDLAGLGEAELARRGTIAMTRLALLLLQRLRGMAPGEAVAALTRWAVFVRALAARADGRWLAQLVWWYVLMVTDVPVEELKVVVARIVEEPPEDIVSTGEKLIAEGRARGLAEGRMRGLAEGRTEGRTEGRAEGRAEVVLRLLAKRFGPLAQAVTDRVRAASIEELDRFAERLLDAPSLAEVFAEA